MADVEIGVVTQVDPLRVRPRGFESDIPGRDMVGALQPDDEVTIQRTALRAYVTSRLGGGGGGAEVPEGGWTQEDLAEGSVGAPQLQTDSVEREKILAEAIDDVRLAQEAVTEVKIATDAITETKISDGAITTPKMTAGSIDGDRITAGTLDADRITAFSITGQQIQGGSITGDKITANWIEGDNLLIDGNATFANNYDPSTKETPAGAQAKANSARDQAEDNVKSGLSSRNYTTIDGGNITTGTIDANLVTVDNLSVGNAEIENAAISRAKIQNLAVSSAKLGSASVTNAKIANAAVTDAKIDNLTADKISGGSISASIITVHSTIRSQNYSFNNEGWSLRNTSIRMFDNVIMGNGVEWRNRSDLNVRTYADNRGVDVVVTNKSTTGIIMGEESPKLGNGFGLNVGRWNGAYWRFYEGHITAQDSDGNMGEVRATNVSWSSALRWKEEVNYIDTEPAVEKVKMMKAASWNPIKNKITGYNETDNEMLLEHETDYSEIRHGLIADYMPEELKVWEDPENSDEPELFGYSVAGVLGYVVASLQDIIQRVEQLEGAN